LVKFQNYIISEISMLEHDFNENQYFYGITASLSKMLFK